MAEQYELTTPITETKTSDKLHVRGLIFDRDNAPSPGEKPGLVEIQLKDNLGNRIICNYYGDEAVDLMKWLNTANFSVNSMHKRILQKLEADGKIPAGDITGTPDA